MTIQQYLTKVESQYFANVPEVTWNFLSEGCQPSENMALRPLKSVN